MRRIPTALTIAGSDSGGGAGIQADLKTFAVMGVHGMSAITSITAQNTVEVRAIHDVPPEIVVSQIEAVADDIGVDAAKTGMLSNRGIIEALAKPLDRYGFPLVVDPVMIAKSGAKLLRDDAIDALIRVVIPRATIVTPNAPEAERLTGMKIESLEDAKEAARRIVEDYGSEAAIVKGGHLGGDYSIDILYYQGRYYEYKAPRVKRNTTHGTGCSFSAAIAAGLAKGRSVPEAVDVAKRLITMAIDYGLEVGRGHGPVNPVAWAAIPAERYRVLEDLEEAIRILRRWEETVARVIPEVQMNIGMALPAPYARTPMDVAAIPGRIARYREGILVKAKPEFGVSRHIASAILKAMKVDPEIRAAGNIAVFDGIEDAAMEAGLTVASFKESVDEALKDDVPGVAVGAGGYGREPVAIVYGKTSVEVAERIVELARRART